MLFAGGPSGFVRLVLDNRQMIEKTQKFSLFFSKVPSRYNLNKIGEVQQSCYNNSDPMKPAVICFHYFKFIVGCL